jgi:hypothetical protein
VKQVHLVGTLIVYSSTCTGKQQSKLNLYVWFLLLSGGRCFYEKMFLTFKKNPHRCYKHINRWITKESLQEMKSEICLCTAEVVQTPVRMSCNWTKGKGKSKGKGHPRTSHEGPEVEQRYNSTLSLTSALDWGGWSRPPAGSFTAGIGPVPIV